MNVDKLKAAELLEAVGTLFLIPEWHTKGQEARDCEGNFSSAVTGKDACSFCAIGGIYAAGSDPLFSGQGVTGLAETYLSKDPAVVRAGDIVDFNDYEYRTAEQVAMAFFRTANRLRKQAAKS